MVIFLIVAFVLSMICLYFDAHQTDKGIRAGIAKEGNTIVKWISRTDKPTFWQVYTIEGVLRGLFLSSGFIPSGDTYPLVFAVLASTTLIVASLHSIQGARQWKWMFANPGQRLPYLNTFWKKFIGFWG